ncbi:MAG: hypothetical protein A2V58_08020 [Candidatus Muproteobacteria bacterium RBG_19FT_COMBO_61_10]|uniref:Uncharacterized protein n=1 Tax=Candidatus Muproteobacteria bacterium RBG_19FT_COMBO_61_10 TaxID=1817761 RepID=A0A1F6UJ39_9PROT|nr:MAG: hypothetical protein A2V58_08020 [Candidatus Muproteobacteria bacterium RBG_19FT_COMBO_61_10]
MCPGKCRPLGCQQHHNPTEADEQAQHRTRRQRLPPGPEGAEVGDPQGDAGNDQRRQVGRHPLLAPHHQAVATQHEQRAHDDDGLPLAPAGREGLTGVTRIGTEQHPRQEKAAAGEQRRRQFLHAHAYGEIARPPHEINRGEGEQGDQASAGRGGHGRGRGLTGVRRISG